MGIRLPENICAHGQRSIEELIKDRARDTAAQHQILFGKLTGDRDGLEELLVKLLTSVTESVSHVLMSSCEDCQVSQIPNQVRCPTGDQISVDPGESSKRPASKNRSRKGRYKRRGTHKHDQGCQATKQVQEAPHMYPTSYPSQNPILEAYFLSFSFETISTQDSETYALSITSETISTQDSEPNSRSFPSETISTQYTSSCPSSASSVRKESVQSNSLSGDLPVLPFQRPQPMIPFSQARLLSLSGDLPFLASQRPLPMLPFSQVNLPSLSGDLPFLPSQCPLPMLPFPQDYGDHWMQLLLGRIQQTENSKE